MDMAERSSSNDLSSAPNSDAEGLHVTPNFSNTIIVSRDGLSNHSIHNTFGSKSNGNATIQGVDGRQDAAPKQRKPRKKKESDIAPSSASTDKKEKGTRRSRGGSTATTTTRKKVKTESNTPVLSLQPTPNAIDSAYSRPIIDLTGHVTSTTGEAAKYSQNGFLNHNPSVSPQKPVISHYNPTPPPPPPPQPPPAPIVRSSMAYDPVRSLTMPRRTEPPPSTIPPQSTLTTPPRMSSNPSTSPAISGIINPPDVISTDSRVIASPYQHQLETHVPSHVTVNKIPDELVKMDVDPMPIKAEPVKKTTPEAAPAKPATKLRAKEQPPPLPTGSGLLSSTLFGGDSGMDASKMSNEKGTSIVLHVDLKNPDNKVINFARMAEEKYGFAAMYPRQAAQKERLARVAAAGAALERAGAGTKGTPAAESGDEDVSVDIDHDSENDGDIAMSGMNGTGEAVNSGTDGPVPKRRKRKDEYDADDPFVDDSEMLWEAQAAASKDGFFVYCGPLVPEGEKPAIERADGTVKRGRGRGRGGGPGSRGGRGAAAAARDTEGGSGGRGGGPGSRGGGVTRKPRITKAERAQRELEKKQREQMAVLAAKPPNYQP